MREKQDNQKETKTKLELTDHEMTKNWYLSLDS